MNSLTDFYILKYQILFLLTYLNFSNFIWYINIIDIKKFHKGKLLEPTSWIDYKQNFQNFIALIKMYYFNWFQLWKIIKVINKQLVTFCLFSLDKHINPTFQNEAQVECSLWWKSGVLKATEYI